jgi:hypothetical protein
VSGEGDSGGVGGEGDPRLRFVWEEGLRAVERQADGLDALHTRAAALLGAASIAAGFLGAAALEERQQFAVATWVGVVAFATVGVLTAWTLRPRDDWLFHRAPSDLLSDYVEHEIPADIDEMHRELALHLESDYNTNDRKLRSLYRWLSVSCLALAVEIIAFLWDLRGRR